MEDREILLKKLIMGEHRAYLSRIRPYVDELTRIAALKPPRPVYIGMDLARPGGDYTVRVPRTQCGGCGKWIAVLPPASQMKCECGEITPVERHCSERE